MPIAQAGPQGWDLYKNSVEESPKASSSHHGFASLACIEVQHTSAAKPCRSAFLVGVASLMAVVTFLTGLSSLSKLWWLAPITGLAYGGHWVSPLPGLLGGSASFRPGNPLLAGILYELFQDLLCVASGFKCWHPDCSPQ